MKSKNYIPGRVIVFSTAVALSGGALFSWGEDVKPVQPAYEKKHLDSRSTQPGIPERLGEVGRVSKLLGADISDAQNQKLGDLKELAIDLESGRVVEAIVSVGGVLGVGDKLVAVPPSAFTRNADHKLRMNVDAATLKNAPSFDLSKWSESTSPQSISAAFRTFNARPYFERVDETGRSTYRSPAEVPTDATRKPEALPKSDNPPRVPNPLATENYAKGAQPEVSVSRLGHVERAGKLIGMNVRNRADEKVGDIHELIVDLPAGRVLEVIVSAGGFLGIGDELNAVPPGALAYNAARDAVVLDVTKEMLTGAPRFKTTDWGTVGSQKYATDVYRYYKVDPYFNTGVSGDNVPRDAAYRDTALTPFDQGTGKADIDMTTQIRKAVVDTDKLSVRGQNVKIITRNGKVTLRGEVANEQEKALIAEIATRYASAGNVDNQLEISKEVQTN